VPPAPHGSRYSGIGIAATAACSLVSLDLAVSVDWMRRGQSRFVVAGPAVFPACGSRLSDVLNTGVELIQFVKQRGRFDTRGFGNGEALAQAQVGARVDGEVDDLLQGLQSVEPGCDSDDQGSDPYAGNRCHSAIMRLATPQQVPARA